MIKRISIWGSTGSIGTQTLDIVAQNPGQFAVEALTTHGNVDLLYEQSQIHRPETVIVTGSVDLSLWNNKFDTMGVEVLTGKEGLLEAANRGNESLVVNALVGSVGLEATLLAIDKKVNIALANKEVLVMAGELVTTAIKKKDVALLPIDSEHSALFQCLNGESPDNVRRLILTASGGPFLNKNTDALSKVTVEEALNHPNWSMGKKVTIDSATLMNKALEVIEARWLFDVESSKIDVVIHPQSIIHSMIEFQDGSIMAQLSHPDMHVPIAYALSYPDRWVGKYGSMDFTRPWEWTFLPPDDEKFPSLNLARQVLEAGGTVPAVMNAADEVAVDLFLSGRIGFTQIWSLIDKVLSRHDNVKSPSLEQILEADAWAREFVKNEILSNK